MAAPSLRARATLAWRARSTPGTSAPNSRRRLAGRRDAAHGFDPGGCDRQAAHSTPPVESRPREGRTVFCNGFDCDERRWCGREGPGRIKDFDRPERPVLVERQERAMAVRG